jgi:triacylglycerol lipase
MQAHHKAGIWGKEFVQLFTGAVVMNYNRTPPAHYLGHTFPNKAPIILIPGILGRWGYMKPVGDRLSLRGHPVHIVPELGLNIYSIPSSAKMLRALIVHAIPKLGHRVPKVERGSRAVRRLLEKKNIKGAIIVAHSKGGLIGKYLLAHHNADGRVRGMVTVSAPFSGSSIAKLVPHDSFQELRTDSEILLDLERHRAANHKIISIYPAYDTHIWAPSGSYLEGALENAEVPVGGHNSLFNNKKIQKAILKAVETLSKTPAV